MKMESQHTHQEQTESLKNRNRKYFYNIYSKYI